MRTPRFEPSLRSAVVASLAVHLAAVLVPLDRWGMGDGPPAPTTFVVSLLEASNAGTASPAATPPAAAAPRVRETPPPPPAPAPAPAPESAEPESALEPAPASAPPARGLPSPGTARSAPGNASGQGPDAGNAGAPYRPPRLLAGALPIDPEESGKLEVPDEIPVRLRVGVDGRVLEIVPEGMELSAPVRDALVRSAEAMRFAPARRGNRPVEGWFSMTFVFRH